MTIAAHPESPSPAPSGLTPDAARPLAFGAAVSGLFTGAFLAAGAVWQVGGIAVPVASITALILIAATPLLRRAARWAGAPRPERCAAWSLLGALPLLFLGAMSAINSDPVLASTWRCGSGDMALVSLSPLAFGLLGALSGLFSFVVTSSRRRRHTGARIHLVSRGALALGAILVGAAAFRAAHKPSTDHATTYLNSLPTIAVLPALPGTPGGASAPAPDPTAAAQDDVDETRFGDIIARRACNNESCAIILLREDGPSAPARLDRKSALGRVATQEKKAARVQRDEKHGFWIIGDRTAFRASDLQITDIQFRDIGDELSAPLGWILGGAAGLLLAAALEYRRHRLAQRLLEIEAAQPGTLGENGWITFDDDTAALRASPDLPLALGPVLRIRRGAGGASAGSYRSEATLGEDEIVAGAREDLAAGQRSRMAALSALGIVAVLLTAAPLLASCTAGLVFGWR